MVSPETAQRKKCNKLLHDITKTYYKGLSEPLDLISKALIATGFNPKGLEGIYCGHDGSCAPIQVGSRTYLVFQWHKMQSGKFEVNAYVS